MSEALTIALIAAGATTFGAVVAVVGVAIGARLNARANQSLEAIKLQNAEVGAVTKLKREAYAEFFGACNQLAAMHGKRPDPNGPEVLNWMNAQAKIEILAPAEVSEAVRQHSFAVSDEIFNHQRNLPPDAWAKSRTAALAAVRQDLKLPANGIQ